MKVSTVTPSCCLLLLDPWRHICTIDRHTLFLKSLFDSEDVTLRAQAIEVERMDVQSQNIATTSRFEAEVYVLSKDEGGRHTPFFPGYRPQFYFRTTDVTGAIKLPEGVEMVMPGDNVQMEVELIAPIAMEEGLRFAVREGGRTVGAGVVARILE